MYLLILVIRQHPIYRHIGRLLLTLFKQHTGGLVVRRLITSEYPLLYVFVVILAT
jgi:hypothetical protein